MSAGRDPAHVLTLERQIDAPVNNVWRCWTVPELLEQWFCPKPWYVTDARIELEPGGELSLVMNGPDGERLEEMGRGANTWRAERTATVPGDCTSLPTRPSSAERA